MFCRFRWVECQFRALALCPPNQHLLEKLLSSLPESLDDTYVRMLRNIEPNLVEYAQSMLNILCCAVRPLSDEELLDALAVKVDKNFLYDPTRRFNNLDALEAICPGFIEVVTDFDTRDVTVRIAHFSVQEFLEAERILRYQDIACFHIQRPQGHTHMAAICLALLLATQASPALEYYARYWPEHLVQCDARAKIENEAVPLFQSTTGYFRRWVETWNVDDDFAGMLRDNIPSPLYYASSLGLASIVSTLLGSRSGGAKPTLTTHVVPPIITIDSEPSSVLDVSENHIDVNVVGGDYGTALQAASLGGHQEVVQLLLDNGADVNTVSEYHGTALHIASNEGHREIIQLLLDYGADVNTVGEYHGTALHIASNEGHREIIQLLLDYGADINAVGGFGGTALQIASQKSHREIVQLLLDHGVNVNTVDEKCGTALQSASYWGHQEVVQLLLDHGADVNAVGGYWVTALHAASQKGHRQVVQLLLDHGADVNAVGGTWGTALQVASSGNHQEVVRLLLDHGADGNAVGGPYRTALQAALALGHQEVVQLLLDHGADVNAVSGYWGAPLQAASVEPSGNCATSFGSRRRY
jgi:ankyrin repeat domain-containing protein 50